MPLASSSLLRLPSELVSNFVISSAAEPLVLVPSFLSTSASMVCSSALSTPPLLSASTLANMRACIWASLAAGGGPGTA